METIFHIEGENLVQLKEKIKQNGITFHFTSDVKNKTPYHEYTDSFDILLEEKEIPSFLEFIKEEKDLAEIRLYTKEKKINNLPMTPYYKLYVVEQTIPPFMSTTFLYQKLKEGIKFVDDYENRKIVPTYLEHIALSVEDETEITGNYQSISYYLESGMPIAFDFGTIKMKTERKPNVTIVTTKLTNYRKRIKSTKTLYDYLFSIPLKTGESEYTLEEYYIPFLEDTFIHFSDTTKK